MGGIGKAARWGLVAGGAVLAARTLLPWLRRHAATPVSVRRFVYVTVAASGVETLWLAELSAPLPGAKRTARTVKPLGVLPGELGVDGVPETYEALVPSPPNRHMAVLSTQMGLDFVDHNIRIIDLHDGSGDPAFNEHRFAGVDRTACQSSLFDAFLAAEAAAGVPPAQLAAYDWTVLLEGSEGVNIPAPALGWRADDALIVIFRFEVAVLNFAVLGREAFRFQTTPGVSPTVACVAGPDPAPPPPGPFAIAPPGGPHAGVILFNGAPLPFVGRKLPFGFPWARPRFVRADKVAGLAA